jgi:hypothetical protein
MNTTSTQYGDNYALEVGVKKELWMWRGAAILLLIANLVLTTQFAISDSYRHAQDNKERAENWAILKTNLEGNRRMIYNVDEHLRQCLGCHAHAPMTTTLPPADTVPMPRRSK